MSSFVAINKPTNNEDAVTFAYLSVYKQGKQEEQNSTNITCSQQLRQILRFLKLQYLQWQQDTLQQFVRRISDKF